MRESTLLVTTSSPTLQSAEAAELIHKRRHQHSKHSLQCSQVLCIYTPAFIFLSLFFHKKKKVRPAVKCCNPDAVTMFLSANHQRHYLFFNRKKLAPLMNSKQFSYAVEYRGRYTAAYDVSCKSTWGLASHYLRGGRAPQSAFQAPGIFISNCQHDLVLSCLACFPFS